MVVGSTYYPLVARISGRVAGGGTVRYDDDDDNNNNNNNLFSVPEIHQSGYRTCQ